MEACCCYLIFAEGPNGRDDVSSHQFVFTLNTWFTRRLDNSVDVSWWFCSRNEDRQSRVCVTDNRCCRLQSL